MQFIGHEIRNIWNISSQKFLTVQVPISHSKLDLFLNAGRFFSLLWNFWDFWSSSFHYPSRLTFAFEANLVKIVKIAELVIVANVSLLKIESNKTSRITKDRNALPLNSQCFLVLQYCCQICQICTNLYHVCLD